MSLHADYLELEMPELADFVLRESGQTSREPTNPVTMLEYLKLQAVMIDLAELLPGQKKSPRGVLSYLDRMVGVDLSLQQNLKRARFTTMHEIGHYVLPNHQNELYICDEVDLSFAAKSDIERQANEFAAELLFKGDQFTRDANDCAIAVESVKTLAMRYDASFEATARRFVERNAKACGLGVFVPAAEASAIDSAKRGRWIQRYTVTSVDFRTKYFTRLFGEIPREVAKQLAMPGRDIVDSIDIEMPIASASGEKHPMDVSFFTNQHSIFALVKPKLEK